MGESACEKELLTMKRHCTIYVLLLLMDLSVCQISTSSNITVLVGTSNYFKTLYCVISEDVSALTWITPTLIEGPVSRYASGNGEIFCNMDPQEACSNFWVRGQWRSVNSLDFFYGPIFDHRWERFKVIETGDGYEVITSRLTHDGFEIAFSIRKEKDAHIYLCDDKHPPRANCYWFILDGWDGSRSVLRKCAKNEIPESVKEFPKPPCNIAVDQNDTKSRVSINEWTHFMLEGKRGTYTLRTLGEHEPFLRYTDRNSNVFRPNHLIIKSRTRSEGIWKFHLYSFLLTMQQEQIQLGPLISPREGTICLAFFAKMCQNCHLNLTLTDSSDNIVHVQQHQNVEWTEIKFLANNLPHGKYKLNVSTESSNTNRFWALDDVRRCTKNDVRVVEINYAGYGVPNYACYSLGLHTFKIDMKDLKHIETLDSTCPENTFGRSCIPCNSILSGDFCSSHAVCEVAEDEKTKCTCAAGYYGNNCQMTCPRNVYGFGCKQRCGQCYYTHQCNYITGRCDPCVQGYTGHTCKTPLFPVLKHPPLINISHTSMVIQLQDNEYEGPSTPSNYIIYFKQRDGQAKWQNTEEFSINDLNPKVINGLIGDTKYIVRVLLRPSNESYQEQFSNEMELTTTCAGLAERNIKIRPTNVSAAINVQTSPETCPLRDFRVSVDAKNFRPISENFSLASLLPYTPYNLSLYFNRTNETLAISFITLEGIPTKVRNLAVSHTTSTEITVTWESPGVPNGNIWCYRVSYAHYRYLGCKGVVRNNESIGKNTTSERMYTIKGLIPYSTYTIQVEGLTTMEGDPAYISVSTLQEDTPDVEELPSLSLNHELDGYTRLVFKQKCEKQRGLLTYHAKLCCSDPWCSCMPKILSITNDDANAHIDFRVSAYSGYKLEVKVQRTNGNYLNRMLTQNFSTSPIVPHSVRNLTLYSKTKNSASLRWRPPYPPTGILKNYKISHRCFFFLCTEKQQIVKGDWCKLWPEFLCATVIIERYERYENYDIQFDVRARNEMPDQYGPRSSVEGKLGVGKPEPPKNLTAEWDDYYNLTVSWIHPDVTNGPLTGFAVKINNVSQNTTQEKEQLLYTRTITNAPPSAKITVTVAAETEAGQSPSIHIETYSPPKTPEFSAEPYVQEAGNTNLSIMIPTSKHPVEDRSSVMYVIVTELNTEKPSNSLELPKQIEDVADVDKYHFSWIAREIPIDGNADGNVLIGSNETQYSNKLGLNVYNRVLKMGTNYIITFLLSNTYMNKTRSRVRKVSCKTTYQEGSGNEYLGLFGLLILPLLCCVVGFILFRKFRRKPVRPIRENQANRGGGSIYDVIALQEEPLYYSTVKD